MDNEKAFSPSFSKVMVEYIKTIPEKLRDVNSKIQDIKNTPQEDTYFALQVVLHKIGGSAGSYGFVQAGVLCKECEEKLKRKIGESPSNYLDPVFFNYLSMFVSELQDTFDAKKLIENQGSTTTDIFATNQFSVSFVGAHALFLSGLKEVQKTKKYPIYVYPTLESAFLGFSKDLSQKKYCIMSSSQCHSEQLLIDFCSRLSAVIQPSSMTLYLLDPSKIELAKTIQQQGFVCTAMEESSFALVLEKIEHLALSSTENKLKAIVIDDDIDTCTFIKELLAEMNIKTISLYSAHDLEQVIHAEKPNLLFIDVHLENEDGLDVLHSIRQTGDLAKTKVIVITYDTEVDIQRRAYSEKVDAILHKPLNKMLVQRRVNDLLYKVEGAL